VAARCQLSRRGGFSKMITTRNFTSSTRTSKFFIHEKPLCRHRPALGISKSCHFVFACWTEATQEKSRDKKLYEPLGFIPRHPIPPLYTCLSARDTAPAAHPRSHSFRESISSSSGSYEQLACNFTQATAPFTKSLSLLK